MFGHKPTHKVYGLNTYPMWEIPRRPDAALSRSKHGLCRSGLVREDVGTGDIFRA